MAEIPALVTKYASHQIYLERLASSEGAKVMPYISNIERRVSAILNALPSKTLTAARQAKVIAEITAITSEELKAYTVELNADNKQLGAYEAEYAATAITDVIETEDYESEIPKASVVYSKAVGTPIKLGENLYTTYTKYLNDYHTKYADQINGIALSAFQSGQTNQQIASQILSQIKATSNLEGVTALTKAAREAKTIARTSTNHFATQAKLAFGEANDDVVIGYRSIGTIDNRTSQVCRGYDQEVRKPGDRDWAGFQTPRHPNCLLGDARITSAYGVSKIYKRAFKGRMYTITSSSGYEVTVTPNHPILTARGWIPAQLINKGDKLVTQIDRENVLLVDGDDNTVVPTIKDVFDSVWRSGKVPACEVPLSAPNFHGDSTDGEVAVVLSDSLLDSKIDFGLNEEIFEHGLDVRAKGGVPLSGFGSFDKFALTAFGSKLGFVGRACKALSFLWRSAVHSRLLLLRSISDMNPITFKQSLYGSWRDAEHIRNTSNTYAGGVKLDNVDSVTFAEFDTHVYNLETVDSCYSANGIITHNCRSALVPEVNGKYRYDDSSTKRPSNLKVDGKRDPKQVSSKQTYYDELSKLSASDQDAILGKNLGAAFRKLDDPEAFAKATIDSLGRPLTMAQLKAKDNELGRILKSI